MPRATKAYFVYILSSLSGTLYVGVSTNVQRRSAEHWIGNEGSFTKKYKVDRLVYFETFSDVVKAIAREKQIKSWRREKDCAYQQYESILGRFEKDRTGEDASLRNYEEILVSRKSKGQNRDSSSAHKSRRLRNDKDASSGTCTHEILRLQTLCHAELRFATF